MKTLRCYDIPSVFRDALDAAVDPETGEINDAGIAEIQSLTLAAEHCIADLACYIRELEMEADAIKTMVANAAERASRLNTQASRWRGYLQDAMSITGKSKIATPAISVSIRNNPPSVSVIAADEIPDAFWRVIPEKREPDKTAIKAEIKAGRIVHGCELTVTQRVDIK